MGNVLDFEKARKDRVVTKLIDGIRELYGKADGVIGEFEQAFMENGIGAIRQLPEFLGRAKTVNPGWAYLGSDVNPDWTGPLFNIVGAAYTEFNLEERTDTAKIVLRYLDGLNYFYSQNQTERFNEPLMAMDVIANRTLYWPGYNPQKEFLATNPTISQAIKYFNEHDGKAFFGAAIAQSKYSTLPLRKGFYAAYPDFVDRSVDFFLAVRMQPTIQQITEAKENLAELEKWETEKRAHAEAHLVELEKELSDEISTCIARFDPQLQAAAQRKAVERNWVNLPRH